MKSYQNQNYEESLALFKEALDEESNYSKELIYNFIASIYLQQDDFENAVVYQEKICEAKPDYRSLVSLGMTYHLLEKDAEAEIAYKKAIELDGQKAEGYASLGALYLGQKNAGSAVESLKKACEYEPKTGLFHANLALAYAMSGDMDNCEAEFKIAEDLKCENLDEFKERAVSF